MPWTTPTLTQTRQQNRDYVTGQLGAPLVPNSNARILADANAALASLNFQYLGWLGKQLLPDTAEEAFLDRFGAIWLLNADGTRGRKAATYASGSITLTGLQGSDFPVGSQLVGYTVPPFGYETTQDCEIGSGATAVTIRATIAGEGGNLAAGEPLAIATAATGVDATATVVTLTGGTDAESDVDLLARILQRIQQPPMGGDQQDYVAWTLEVAGVTRAWCYPQEMGIGTVTVRFMCDVLRAAESGFPQTADITAVETFLYTVRPVTVQDLYVVAPIAEAINLAISNLVIAANATLTTVKAAISASLTSMLAEAAIPGQTIFNEWVSAAIRYTQGVVSFDLAFADAVMPDNGHLATLGTITRDGFSGLFAMTDTWVARTGTEYAQALRDLLPDGPAWPRSPSSYLQKWCAGNGLIWGDVDASAAQLLTVDSDPRVTIAMLPDWERNWGLPDPCLALPPQTIAARQAALVNKMTILGGQSIAFFTSVAASLGYAITVTEYSPYMCGVSQCGDTRNAAGVYRWQCGAASIRYYWTVNVGAAPLSWFRCGEGQCGVDPMLTIGLDTGLECRLRQWAPAHTQVLFNYSGLSSQGSMAGTP